MHITFIKPNMIQAPGGDAVEPLVFGLLASLTPHDISRTLYDERIEPIDFTAPTDLVAISCDTYCARRSYQIAARYRERGIPVVIGGCHPTLCPEEASQYVETVVVGDAEDTWPVVVQDAQCGRLQRIYRSTQPALDGLQVDRSVFAGKRYGPMRLVQFGRGCIHGCDFCSIHALYGNHIRTRPVDEVIREIEELKTRSKARAIIFTDDNLFANKPQAMELLRRLVPLKLRWSGQATLDVATDKELLRLMAQSGCLAIMIGLESLRDDNLAQMRKARAQTSRTYARSIQKIHDHGIMVYGGFIFGYDHDTVQDFGSCLDFALHQKLFLANFNPLIPMPGTALYARLKNEGRLINDPWWLDPAYRYGSVPFQTRSMRSQELDHQIFEMRRKFNSFASIARRALNFRANIHHPINAGAFLAVNWINRREIYRKQGLPLGVPGSVEPLMESLRP